jgi:hypothetical protein
MWLVKWLLFDLHMDQLSNRDLRSQKTRADICAILQQSGTWQKCFLNVFLRLETEIGSCLRGRLQVRIRVQISEQIRIRFGAHAISCTIRILSVYAYDTIGCTNLCTNPYTIWCLHES